MKKCTCGELEACAQCGTPDAHNYPEALTDAERIAYERFNKPEWSERSHFRLRVALAVSQETVTRCGAKIENLQDRITTLKTAIRQIRDAIGTDSCDGDSTYAAGVNAAVARHTEGIDTILREARIATAALAAPTVREAFERWVISEAMTMYGEMINPEVLLAKDDALLDVYYRHDIRNQWEGWNGLASMLHTCAIMELGPTLKKFRKAKNITQEDIAQMVGVARSTIANIDTAKFFTTPETYQRYADALGLDIQVLLTEKPKQNACGFCGGITARSRLCDDCYNASAHDRTQHG